MFIINIKKIDYLYEVLFGEAPLNCGRLEVFTFPDESTTVVLPLP